MKTRRIGIAVYDGVQGLDVAGPADVFTAANALLARNQAPYEIVLIGERKGPVASESGLTLYANATFSRCGLLDTIIIPGGRSLRLEPKLRGSIAKWLRGPANRARRVASVCTGIYALAESGLLNGRSVTTHWRFADDVQRRWKKLAVNADSIFIKDGKVYTSAGITAGIDLCLALVEEDFGNDVALGVARELVVYLKRSGGQLQYSQPLSLQTKAKNRFGDIAVWVRGHLDEELTVERLAERANLSPRHFNRKFKDNFGLTPADFVEEVRLDEARWLLVNGEDPMSDVANAVGYTSDDTFRRAFERRFGVAPVEYRRRFSVVTA
ncbi:MAG TPA: GlxA family transcriptional regulator [Candidatus Rubrimentiphilum sp.]|nr:GlxA family transcriptional regulator [Candidatus Rubrimentiphilum sp.]